MADFTAARTNMVDCQIHTMGVVSPAILNAFKSLPREKFVPANLQAVAYNDEAVSLGNGRYLLEPSTHARMVQAAEPNPGDRVLDVGGGTGYSAAILASMTKDVVAIDEKPDFLKRAEELWSNLKINNIRCVGAKLPDGAPALGPFDLIFVNGSVAEIPDTLTHQLADHGRLVAIVRKEGAVMGQVTLVRRTGGKNFSSYPLFESGSPYLPGFEPKTRFSF